MSAPGVKRAAGRSGIEVADEVMHLLRGISPGLLAGYFIGTVPFVLMLLFFWSDMSRGAFAETRCLPLSLLLAGLFIWMKCWQTVFSAGLMDFLLDRTRPWSWARVARVARTQLIVQPLGLIAIPLSLLIMLPFYAVHAFYQNMTVLGDGEAEPLGETVRRARREALRWPVQNHMILWLLSPWVLILGMIAVFGMMRLLMMETMDASLFSGYLWFLLGAVMLFSAVIPLAPFAGIVAANIGLVLILVPHLLRTLFGWHSLFTLSGIHAVFNTTYLATVFALTYLCMDPLIKAAHVLRCFQGAAQHNGQDLRLALRLVRKEPG